MPIPHLWDSPRMMPNGLELIAKVPTSSNSRTNGFILTFAMTLRTLHSKTRRATDDRLWYLRGFAHAIRHTAGTQQTEVISIHAGARRELADRLSVLNSCWQPNLGLHRLV